MFLTGEKADVRIPLCYMLMNAIALHLRYIVLFRLVLNPQEKADMFVERSRNKSIDKKSVLCYSESTNHVAIGIFVCDFSH